MAICSGFSHEKWWFSIVMLVYQRVPTAKVRIISSHESTVTWVASWSWSRYRSDSHMGRFCAYKPAMGLIGKVPLWRNDKIRKYIYIWLYMYIYWPDWKKTIYINWPTGPMVRRLKKRCFSSPKFLPAPVRTGGPNFGWTNMAKNPSHSHMRTMVLQDLPTFARTKSTSFVGKDSIDGAYGILYILWFLEVH